MSASLLYGAHSDRNTWFYQMPETNAKSLQGFIAVDANKESPQRNSTQLVSCIESKQIKLYTGFLFAKFASANPPWGTHLKEIRTGDFATRMFNMLAAPVLEL